MTDWGDADYGLLSPATAGTKVSRLTGDRQLVQSMLDVELAWVEVLAQAGHIDPAIPEAVRAAALAADYDVASLAARSSEGGNAVIPLLADLRSQLAASSPAAAAAVHRGATSQDVLDTALMLLSQRALEVIIADLKRAAAALARLAGAHRHTLMAARTLTQHSVPTTFGLKVAGWLSGVGQAGGQLTDVAQKLPLQWGGAAGTMAAVTEFCAQDAEPLDLAARLAGRLGLVDPPAPWHTNRITMTALGSAAAAVVIAAGRVANDVLVLGRAEIAEVREPGAAGRGVSTAMPQKQNPVLSVLIRSAALAMPGYLAQLHAAAAGAVDERPDGAWHAEWEALRQLLRLAGGTAERLAELAEGLTADPAKMRANLDLTGALIVSERLMAALAPLLDDGAPGSGKRAMQALVGESLTSGMDLAVLLRAAVSPDALPDEALAGLLEPSNYLGQANELISRILVDVARWSEQ